MIIFLLDTPLQIDRFLPKDCVLSSLSETTYIAWKFTQLNSHYLFFFQGMQWANPRALILNIGGSTNCSWPHNCSGAKWKIFTSYRCNFLISNIIVFRLDGFQPHHPPVVPTIHILILMHCSLFIYHVNFFHHRRHHFFLNVF